MNLISKKTNVILCFLMVMMSLSAFSKDKPKYERTVEGVKEYSLQNGMQILLIPDATQSNMVVNIVYKVGSRHEGYGETGMAHLLEHMLFKSTKNLGDIKKMLGDKGGNANGTTWYDRTNYYEIFPSSDENLKWSLEMEADRMINATILQSDLDKEFSVVRNEFEIGENDPGSILMERIISTGYLWHNYGNSTIGSREDIERVKADRLRVFYQKYYQPDNAVLIIGGKFDESKALQYIEDYFSIIPRPGRILEKTYTVEPAQDGERFVELKRSGDVQYVAAMYHVSALADQDYAAMDVLAEILQSDPSGYLYKALVETKKGSSVFAYQPVLHDPGFVYIGLEVPKSTEFTDSRKAFIASLDAIGGTAYTDEDVKRGKAKMLKQIDDITNNTINFSINMTEYIGGGDYRLWYLTRDRYEKVTVEDVRRVAKKYFLANNRTLGVFIPSGTEERIKPEEFDDARIAGLTADYKGRKVEETTSAFEASIPNVKSHLTEKTLPSGLRYSFLKKPIKGGKVMVSFRFPTGDAESLFGKSEVASMMARLMTAGTKNMSKEQLRDKLDAMKSSFGFSWSGQSLFLSVSTYESSLSETMDLVRQCLTEPSFPENELEKMKAELKSNIESQMNEPQSIVFNVFSRKTEDYTRGHILYSPTPKEQLEDVAAVNRQQIAEFHSRFIGAQNGIGTVIGDIEQSKVDAVVSGTFGGSKSNVSYKRFIPSYSSNKPYTERINTPDKENGAVACGANVKISRKSPDYPAMMMANEMLGSGGFLTSRIPIRLREKEGISYGAGSQLDAPIDHESGGWVAYAFYNPKMVGRVDSALHEEISLAINKGFTAEELASSKVSWKNDRTTALGTDNFLMSLINNAMFTGTSIDEFDKLSASVEKLNVDDVNAAIRKYLSMDDMVFIFAGDFSKK